jgi:CRP-like cAMP-binding protein
MSDAKTRLLSRVPLFAQCSQKELEFIASRTDEVDVRPGRQLTSQGQPGDAFYVLLEGEADVDVNGDRRPALAPGDFFGEMSMLDRGPATATVVTTTPARLMVMSHAQFRDAIKASDALLTRVMAVMGKRLRVDAIAEETAKTSGG